MSVESPGFIARWTAVCGLGLGVGLILAIALAGPLEVVVGMVLVTPVMLAIAGSVLGVGQSLAIGGRTARGSLRWIVASAVGMAVGMSAGVVLVEALGRAITGEQVRLVAIGVTGRFLGLALIGAFSGFAIGLAQAVGAKVSGEARRRWTLWCVVGYGTGLPLGGLIAGVLPGGLASPAGFAVFLGLAGVTAGLLTARHTRELVGPAV